MSWETFRQEAGDWAARKWFGGHYKEAYGVDEASLEASKGATDASFEGTAAHVAAQGESARIDALRAEVAAYDKAQPAAVEEAAPAVDPAIVEAPVGVPVEPVEDDPAETVAVEEAPASAPKAGEL